MPHYKCVKVLPTTPSYVKLQIIGKPAATTRINPLFLSLLSRINPPYQSIEFALQPSYPPGHGVEGRLGDAVGHHATAHVHLQRRHDGRHEDHLTAVKKRGEN